MSSVGRRDRDAASYQTEREQEARCRSYADSRGWDVVTVESDIDASGARWDRDGLERVLELAEAGTIDSLVVFRLSRLGRGLSGVLATVERLRTAGVALASVEDGFDLTNAQGRFFFNLLASFDEYERELRGEYWESTRARARARGVLVGPTPYGYLRHAGGDRAGLLYPCPERGPLVRRLFRDRATGVTFQALAELLDREAPRPDGKLTSATQTARIISSRVYRGEVRQAGDVVLDAHDPLVNETEWQAAQDVRVRPPTTSDRYDFLLAGGVVRCGGCGEPMSGQSTGGRHRNVPQYRCKRRTARGVCPAPTVIGATIIESYVTAHVLRWMRTRVATMTPTPSPDVDDLERAARDADDEVRAYIAEPGLRQALAAGEWRTGLDARLAARDTARRLLDAARDALPSSKPPVTVAEVEQDRELLRGAIRGAVAELRVDRGRGRAVEERVTLRLGA